MRLFELSEVYNTMQSLEIEEEQLSTMLQSFDMSLSETVEDLAKFIQSLESDADAYDKQIKMFSAKKSATNKKIESVKEYMKNSLLAMGKEKVKCNLFTISFRKSTAVIIDDEDLIPQKFKEYERICKIDKNEIKKAFAEGNVTGAHIQENLNLQIK